MLDTTLAGVNEQRRPFAMSMRAMSIDIFHDTSRNHFVDAATAARAPMPATPASRRTLPLPIARRFAVAPMMGYTDRHFRYLLRLLSPNALLYTEMLTTGAVLHHPDHALGHDAREQPTALQLGGCSPKELAEAARLGERAGYAEINLNVGCPSPRVASARFGACLMADPKLVAACVSAMRDACVVPITVKCRLGIDEHDNYEFLHEFVSQLCASAVDALIVHARIALLDGLTPQQNREIPPLDYERVRRLRNDFPDLPIILNGGITSLTQASQALHWNDGIMVGRAACSDPLFVARLDELVSGMPLPDEHDVLGKYAEYARDRIAAGEPFGAIARRALGLFTRRSGARAFRRELTHAIHTHVDCADALLRAADRVARAN